MQREPHTEPNRLSLWAGSPRGTALVEGLYVCRQKWFTEGFVKIVAALKISAGIFVGFGQPTHLHHIEDDPTEILTGADAPFFQQAHSHGTELRQGKIADALQQFLTADMPEPAMTVFGNVLLGIIERLADKEISVGSVALVFGLDPFECFFETDFVHVKVLFVQPTVAPDGRREPF
jgi:hypothetical protein